jgi:hypothetical protein
MTFKTNLKFEDLEFGIWNLEFGISTFSPERSKSRIYSSPEILNFSKNGSGRFIEKSF